MIRFEAPLTVLAVHLPKPRFPGNSFDRETILIVISALNMVSRPGHPTPSKGIDRLGPVAPHDV